MPQELTTETVKALPKDSNLVRPYDKVTIWATGKGNHKAGKELKVHPLLAAKLIAAGKATEKPADKKAK